MDRVRQQAYVAPRRLRSGAATPRNRRAGSAERGFRDAGRGRGGGPHEAFDVHLPVADVGAAAPIVSAPPAQLLGYYAALLRGHDPDKPRNLAKSVTVR